MYIWADVFYKHGILKREATKPRLVGSAAKFQNAKEKGLAGRINYERKTNVMQQRLDRNISRINMRHKSTESCKLVSNQTNSKSTSLALNITYREDNAYSLAARARVESRTGLKITYDPILETFNADTKRGHISVQADPNVVTDHSKYHKGSGLSPDIESIFPSLIK